MGTLIAGGGLAGGVANMGYKKAAKETIKGLVRQNVIKGLSKEAAEEAAEKTVIQLVQKNKLKATQVLMQSGSQKGIGGGITKELATEIVEAGASKLPNKIMSSAIGGAGGMGLYGGLQSAFGQKIQSGTRLTPIRNQAATHGEKHGFTKQSHHYHGRLWRSGHGSGQSVSRQRREGGGV